MLAKSQAPKQVIGVLEDNHLLLKDITEELEFAGYVVVGFKNGSIAFEFVSNNTVDLILCDINMPVMDGREFLKTLRNSNAPSKDAPFVFLTALTDRDEILSSYADGADDYICKPIDFDVLLSKVSATLKMSMRKDNQHQTELQLKQNEIDEVRNELFKHKNFDQVTSFPTKEHFITRLNNQLRSNGAALDGSILIIINTRNANHLKQNIPITDVKVLLSMLSARIIKWFIEYENSDQGVEVLYGFSGFKTHFYIFVPGVFSDALANKICTSLIEELRHPVAVDDKNYSAFFSMGICSKRPSIISAEELIEKAEKALINDETINFYKGTEPANDQSRKNILGQINTAINSNQFYLEYQPKVDIKTSLIIGAEALIRWKQDTGQIIHPDGFIPLINSPDYMLPITAWVLKESCQQISRWKLKDICISINIPPFCLEEDIFQEVLKVALDQSGIDPALLEFEILETSVIKKTDVFVSNILHLKELGIKLSLDDFGSGFSNYDYLSHIQFDSLKIDRSIVADIETDPQKRSVVESMIYLSKKLGMKSLAEGVETKGCLDVLKSLNCDHYQGFYKYKPIAPDAFIDLLKEVNG